MQRFSQYIFLMIITLLCSTAVEAQTISDSDRKDIEQSVFTEYGYYDAAEIEKRTRQWVLDQPMPATSVPASSAQFCNRKCEPVTSEILSLLAPPENLVIDGYNNGRNQFFPHLNVSFSPPSNSGLTASRSELSHYLVRMAYGHSHVETYLIPLLSPEPKEPYYALKLRDLDSNQYFVQVKAVYKSGSSNWTAPTYFSVVDDTAQVLSLAPSEIYKCLRIHGYANKDFLKDVEQLSCNSLVADVQFGSVNLTDAEAGSLSRLYGLRQLDVSFMTQLSSVQALNARFIPHLSWLSVRGGPTTADGLHDVRTLETVILKNNNQLSTIPPLPAQASYIDMSTNAVTSGAAQLKGYPRKVVKLNNNPLSDDFFADITHGPLTTDSNAASIEILDIAETVITQIDDFSSIQTLSHININDTLVGSVSNTVDISPFVQGLCGLQMDNTNARILQGFRPIQFLSIKNNPTLHKVKSMNNAAASNADREHYFLPNYVDLSGSNGMQCQHLYNLHDRWDNLAHVNLDGSNGLSCPDYSNSDVFNRPTDCRPNKLLSVEVYEGTATKRRYITWEAKPEHEQEYARWGVTQYEISELSKTGEVLDVHYVPVDAPQPFTIYSDKADVYSIKVCTENQCGPAKEGIVSNTGLSPVENLKFQWDAAGANFVLQFSYPQAVFDTPFGRPEYFMINPLYTQLPGTPDMPVIQVGATNQTPWMSVPVGAQQYLGSSFEVSACREDIGCGAGTQIVVIQPGGGSGELPVPQWSNNGVSVTDHTRIELNWNWGGQSTQDVDYVEIVETQPIFKIDALVTDPSNFGHKEIKYFIDKINQPLVLNRPARGTYEFRLRACERNRDGVDICSELSPEYNVSGPDAEITRDDVTIDPDTGPELFAENDTGTLKKPREIRLIHQGNSRWYLRWKMHAAHFNSAGLKPDYFQLKSLSSGSTCRLPNNQRVRDFKVNYGDGHHNLPEWTSYKKCQYIFSQTTLWSVQSCVNGAGCTLPVFIGEEPNLNVVEPVPVEETLENTDGPGSLNPGAWWHPELSGIGWQFFWANQAAETGRVMYGNTYDLVAYWYTYTQIGKQWTPVWFEAKLKRADNENFYEGFLQFHDRRSGQLEEVNVGTLKVFTNLGTGDNRYIDLNINLTDDSVLTQIGGIDLGPYEPVNPNDDSGELKIRLNDFAIEIIGPSNDGGTPAGRFGLGNDADHYSGIWQTQQDSDADPILNMGTWIERGLEFTTISTHDSQGLPIWFNAQTCDGVACNRPGAGFFDDYINGANGYSLSWVMEGFYPLGAKPLHFNLGSRIRTVGEMARCFSRPEDFRQSKLWISINDILADGAGYNRGINLNFGGNQPASCANWPGSTGDLYKKASFHGIQFDVVQNSEVLAGNSCDPDDGACLLTISWYTDDDFPAIEPKFSIDGSDYLPLNSIEGCEDLPTVDPFITREFECTMTVSGSYQFQLHKPSYSNLQTESVPIAQSDILTIEACNNPDCQSTLDLSSEPPSTEALPALETDQASVGITLTEFNVDQMGQANYSVPIFAGKGTSGVAPQIALQYNSSGNNGHLGAGWSISGVTVISRCRDTAESTDVSVDFFPQPLSFGVEDKFCLNGERLLVSNGGEYGAKGTEYRTERDQIARIISHGGANNNPEFFTVERKDGSTSYYGATSNSNISVTSDDPDINGQSYAWAVNRYQDNMGNYIDYDYQKLSNMEFVLTDVEYTGNDVVNPPLNPYNAIRFIYEQRDDSYESYLGGVKFGTTQRLAQINSFIDNTLVREYTLDYDYSTTSGRSLLKSLQECRGNTCLPLTQFTWSEPEKRFQAETTGSNTAFPREIKSSKLGDINADGRSDLVFVDEQSNNFKIAYANGHSGFGVASVTSLIAPSGDEIDNKWHLLDYNADGRQDLLKQDGTVWNVYLAESGNSGFSSTPISTGLSEDAGADFQVTDINGDGLSDLLYPSGGLAVRFLERQADGFAFSTNLVAIDLPGDPAEIPGVTTPPNFSYIAYRFHEGGDVDVRTHDINGDGVADLMLKTDVYRLEIPQPDAALKPYQFISSGRNSTSRGEPIEVLDSSHWVAFVNTGYTTNGALDYSTEKYYIRPAQSVSDTDKVIRFVDINTDGLTDILTRNTINNWSYYLSNGAGFNAPQTITPISNDEDLQIFDYNLDGFLDIVYPLSVGEQSYYVKIWQADGFANNGIFTGARAQDVDQNLNLFMDINGDGATDHIRVDSQGRQKVYPRQENYVAVDKITTFTNSYDYDTEVLYRPLTFSSTYQQGDHGTTALNFGNGSPVFDVMGALYVIREVKTDAPVENAVGQFNSVRYQYQNARMQTGGRGFLGFETVRMFTPTQGDTDSQVKTIKTETTYHQDFPFNGMPKLVEIYQSEEDFYDTDNVPPPCNGVDDDCFPPPCEPGTICNILQRSVGEDSRLISRTINDMESIVTSSTAVFPYVRKSTQQTFSPEGGELLKSHEIESTHDDYGNPLTLTEIIRDGNNQVLQTNLTSNVYTNLTANGQWFIGLLENSSKTMTRTGQVGVINRVAYDYDYSTGLLIEERNDETAGDELFLRTIHQYDDYGNEIKQITCSGATLTSSACINSIPTDSSVSNPLHVHRYQRTEFDANGRYVIKTFNTKEHQITHNLQFDVYGNPLRSADALGRVTQNRYDVMGRLTSTRSVLGEWTQTSRQWCDDLTAGSLLSCPAGMGLVLRVRELAAGGEENYTYLDILGREVVTIKRTLNAANSNSTSGDDRYMVNKIWHDRFGRKVKLEENHFLNAQANDVAVTETRFDRFNRPVRYILADGSEEQMSHDGYQVVMSNTLGQRRLELKNALGHLVNVQDFDQAGSVANYQNSMSYIYDSLGKLKSVTRVSDGSAELLIENRYDIRGRKTFTDDMDTGIRRVTYNALGEVVTTRDSKLQVLKTYRDTLGRTIQSTSEISSPYQLLTRSQFNYDSYAGYDASGLLLYEEKTTYDGPTITHFEKTHLYDALYRAERTDIAFTDTDNVCVGGECNYSVAVYYDKYSRIKYQQDASGKAIQNAYTNTGYLSHIYKADDPTKEYYRIVSTDKWGKVSQDRRGGSSILSSGYYRDPMRGWNTDIVSAYQQYNYMFDRAGNLLSRRQDGIISGDGDHLECFEYDRLNRLQLSKRYQSSIAGSANCLSNQGVLESMDTDYDGRGNLSLKDGLSYEYYTVDESTNGFSSHQLKRKGNQLLQYDANGNNVSMSNFINASGQFLTRRLSYTAFDKVKRVWTVSGSNEVEESQYRYDTDEDRYYRKDISANNEVKIIHYIGNVEIVHNASGPETFRRHLGQYAVITEQGPSIQAHYLFTDHLGSVDVITDADGNIVQRMSFSAWGERRNPVSHNELLDITAREFQSTFTTRGFTGHEMLDTFGLINMGGRVYDAALGRMLQADPVVQDANTSQSFNRYTYVHNNPLSFTDPTGYFSLRQLLSAVVGVVLAVILPGLGWSAFWTGFATGFASSIILTGNLKASLRAGLIAGALFFAQDAFTSSAGMDAASSGGKGASGGVNDTVSQNALAEAAPVSGSASGATGLASGASAFDMATQIVASLDPEAGAVLGFLRGGIYNIKAKEFYSFGGVVQNLVSTYGKLKAQEELERFALKNGLSLAELNLALISMSYAGNKIVGTRFYQDDFLGRSDEQGVEGILSRKRGTGLIDAKKHRLANRSIGLLFDTVDIALGFQGLITASGYEAIKYGDRTRNIGGFSLGSMDANNLAARGYFPSATSKSLVFGNVAHANVKVEIGALDIVNGGFLGKILNPFSKLMFDNNGCWLHEMSGCY